MQVTKTPTVRRTRINSIGVLMRGRVFVGRLEVDRIPYEVTYSPTQATVQNGALVLTGSLTVIDSRPNARTTPRSRTGVRATLAGIQGGIGTAPPRTRMPAEIYSSQPNVPAVDSSGAQSFAGVLYMRIDPMSGDTFGLRADLSRVQLNARLFPADDAERALQAAYSSAADSLLGGKTDNVAAQEAVKELNRLLSAS